MGGIGIAFLAGFLIVCNIVLDVALVLTFKKKISDKKDEVVGTAKREMDLIIADLNRQTDRNITLYQDYMREFKAAVAEADRHMTVAKSEIEKLNHLQAQLFAQRVQQTASLQDSYRRQKGRSAMAGRAAEQYLREAAGLPPVHEPLADMEAKKNVAQQGDLFDDAPVLPEPNVFTVMQDGTSYTSMPVIGPNVTYADDPVRQKKDFGTLVRERYDRGESVEEIATALGRSTTEVQFALDMGA